LPKPSQYATVLKALFIIHEVFMTEYAPK